ncbi:MAG: DUF4258 domain-containing protein [Prevotella sp.]|jgi:RHS repeat-associated protein|nr:DUF4258 domain-containing protein [Prevotella sp.]
MKSDLNKGILTMTKTTDYVGNIIYENNSLKRILVDGGYIENGIYYYYINDHLENNRAVVNSGGTVIQKNHYYPFGMSFAENTVAEQGLQPYKYNNKELDQMHGVNLYDYGARHKDDFRFTTIDPLAEKYYSISPYAYVGNNPLLNIDPSGMDYWSTNDPGEIARFLSSIQTNEDSDWTRFNFKSWVHITDSEFIGGLTYNDETQMFHTSYVTAEPNSESSNGYEYIVNSISVKGAYYPYAGENGNAGIASHRRPLARGNLETLGANDPIFIALTLGRSLTLSATSNVATSASSTTVVSSGGTAISATIQIGKHALQRMSERGISKKMVEAAIRKGVKVYDPKNGVINHILKGGFGSGQDLLVGTNPVTGVVTTVIRGRHLSNTRFIPL